MEWYHTTALVSTIMIGISMLKLRYLQPKTGDDYIGEVIATIIIIGGLIALVIAIIGWVANW